MQITIKKADSEEKNKALEIARMLPDWFSKTGLKNIEIDFNFNQVVVACNPEVVGFLCFTTYCGTIQIIWMAVIPNEQRNGIGNELLKWLEDEARKLGIVSLQVDTLSDDEDYEPYERTRNFYFKNGFKKILSKKASIPGWDDQIVLEKVL